VKFGLLASHQYLYSDDLGQRLSELWDLAETAQELGYDSMWTIHHYVANLATLQPISMTARLSGLTDTMTIGTAILLAPFLHPVHVAEEFATLDQMSGGRVVLGLGAGYRDNEFDALGILRSSRAGRLVESIEIIRAMWTREKVHYEGRYYQVPGHKISVPPHQPGGPPIWIGAGAKPAVRRAAVMGDAWFAPGNSPNPRYLEKALALHDQALTQAGKSPEGREYPLIVELFCGPDDETAIESALPYMEREYSIYSEYEAISWQKSRIEELVRSTFHVGSPATLIKRIETLQALGINHLVFRPFWTGMPASVSTESVTRFAQEVIPHFRKG
jgi:alkanesulfonate monooxygenase SsuD/methylene tetrahydromethanopterin reductase-like flavin-dependent oxidoreductase (luciferase family)